jgi:Zn-finger nucleic acid-binding protein
MRRRLARTARKAELERVQKETLLPLLMCPNCQSGMQSLTRSDVEFDMCPTCRGVWLDRGELEKIVENARASAGAAVAMSPSHERRPANDEREYDERGERGDDARRRRKRGFDIFDIFD